MLGNFKLDEIQRIALNRIEEDVGTFSGFVKRVKTINENLSDSHFFDYEHYINEKTLR